ncbi:MAG TPA: phosphate acyltransferase PlsX [Pseudomonadales bacterium]|nr:phosphate acyltransferase PlsX [Pseudomonadales bacterium]HMZ70530.1 phosphate acyltransferase PlsX [Pseudomonadales bacterium]HNB83737.1 phosphate acyltransferase PlsX [Pseudomonadales bacterium]HNC76759.1 phosphate acyltransferase PlsX [Pseudomonadales bacterium]HND27307.1 phosphate acyltransferase PlsX [Pseudomonadales bacterium]
MTMRTVAIDVMGGDHGPAVTVPAALQSLSRDPLLHLLLVGRQEQITPFLRDVPAALHERLQTVDARDVVAMDERPSVALRSRKPSSMWLAIECVQSGRAQACVSAGNTGALMVIGRHLLKMVAGIDRPAIITQIPTATGHCHLLDLGANVALTSEHLHQFAIMGSVAAAAMDGLEAPRVGLLNIGEEEIKGNEQIKLASQLIRENARLNYIGYIEGDDIFRGTADVVVCDGFVGNVAIKTSEGLAELIDQRLNAAFRANILSRFVGLLAWPILRRLRRQIDPGRYNGATLLGLQGILVKSHGDADVDGFRQAIEVAVREVDSDVPQQIHRMLEATLA